MMYINIVTQSSSCTLTTLISYTVEKVCAILSMMSTLISNVCLTGSAPISSALIIINLTISFFTHHNIKFQVSSPLYFLIKTVSNMLTPANFLVLFLMSSCPGKHTSITFVKKITTGIHYLTKVRHFIPSHSLKTIYDTFIESHIRYGIESWGCVCKTSLNPLLTLQKRAIRIMNFLPPWSSTLEFFATSGILTICQLSYFHLAILMYKLVNGLIILDDIILTHFSHNIACRSQSNNPLSTTKVNTNYGKQKINYIGCILWNNIDPATRNLSANNFKKEIKIIIIIISQL